MSSKSIELPYFSGTGVSLLSLWQQNIDRGQVVENRQDCKSPFKDRGLNNFLQKMQVI
ncbi:MULTISPECIES: hypothetical protein [unclassified Microcoleus]|uniref:hypothetical protein n=1 Tax=unclassified Microcoleus TaxID=2642155 RepID=UPI002FCEEA22